MQHKFVITAVLSFFSCFVSGMDFCSSDQEGYLSCMPREIKELVVLSSDLLSWMDLRSVNKEFYNVCGSYSQFKPKNCSLDDCGRLLVYFACTDSQEFDGKAKFQEFLKDNRVINYCHAGLQLLGIYEKNISPEILRDMVTTKGLLLEESFTWKGIFNNSVARRMVCAYASLHTDAPSIFNYQDRDFCKALSGFWGSQGCIRLRYSKQLIAFMINHYADFEGQNFALGKTFRTHAVCFLGLSYFTDFIQKKLLTDEIINSDIVWKVIETITYKNYGEVSYGELVKKFPVTEANKRELQAVFVDCIKQSDCDAMRFFLREGFFDLDFSITSFKPLVLAVLDQCKDSVICLLEHNPSLVNEPDDEPPLYHALGLDDIEMCDLLVKNGADTKILNTRLGQWYMMGMIQCNQLLQEKNLLILKWLLEHKANPNISDNNGYTPLTIAIENEDCALVELLLKNGADPNTIGRFSKTSGITIPLWYVIQNNKSLEVLKLLLEYKVDLLSGSLHGYDAVSYAHRCNRLDIVELLSSYFAK